MEYCCHVWDGSAEYQLAALDSIERRAFRHKLYSFIANVTIVQSNADLPEVKDGDSCTPGQFYNTECNRCLCTNAGKFICTKMACIDMSHFTNDINGERRLGKKAKPTKKATKNAEEAGARNSNLPSLPDGSCVPGKVYRKACRKCFCNHKGEASCSLNDKNACAPKYAPPTPVLGPEDVRAPFKREELKRVETLPSASHKCEPGKLYKVSCNNCVCTERYNLLCSKKLCLSFEDINRVTADARSGKKCSGQEVTKQSCVECRCIEGRSACQRIKNCYSETRIRLSKGRNDTLKMQLDPFKDKCVPFGIYRDNCNHCYCQANGSLRCTIKTCLNYSQIQSLNARYKQQEKL